MNESAEDSGNTPLPKISQPATNALRTIGVTTVEQLTEWTQKEVAALHGMGPKGIRILRGEMEKLGIDFRKSTV